MKEMLERARAAKMEIAGLSPERKNAALNAMADMLLARSGDILAANAEDLERAKGTISDVMLDRLRLTDRQALVHISQTDPMASVRLAALETLGDPALFRKRRN